MNRVEQLERNLATVKEAIELADLVDKLDRNPTFKKVFHQSYFQDEAVRLVSLLSAPSMQSAEQQALINNAMRGIGELKTWLEAVRQRGTQCLKAKADIEAELEYIASNPTEFENEM